MADQPPEVRLAWGAAAKERYRGALGTPPAVRLAAGGNERTKGGRQRKEALSPPDVRLVGSGLPEGARRAQRTAGGAPDVRLVGATAVKIPGMARGLCSEEDKPALLVSYVYLKQFQACRAQYHFRDWVMDSGAFSAKNSGTEIVLDDYITKCRELIASDPQLTEVFGLDVIGDYKGTRKNAEAMWKANIPAIPTFHIGSPWTELKSLCAAYPKVALGGMVGHSGSTKMKFLNECFGRVWPHKLHGFGIGSEKLIMAFPFHSVDAANWEIAPTAFGRWTAYGGAHLSLRGGSQNLRVEVEHFLRIESRARERWAKTWADLETK